MSLISNKKINLTYEVKERIEAGVELLGFEVKALRAKLGALDGARVLIRGGEAFTVGVFIPPYQTNNTPATYDPYRTRKLLLHKKDMEHIIREEEIHNLTTVPISLYLKNNLIKCELGLCRRKQKHDKREDVKKKDSDRSLRNSKNIGHSSE
jgi:SsrA-binding protein